MKWYYLTFRSVTMAQRGESALKRGGIACTLQRAPRLMEEHGCGYALRIRQRDGNSSVLQLRLNGVVFNRVYEKGVDGSIREVANDLFG